jgi:LacI family transcriptional regulator
MATMSDVARLAGVSVTTVSHVINGTRPASAATKRRVLAAIERTGYAPNTIARALARARTQSLGLAIGGLGNPYLSELIAAVERAATAAGYTLLLGDTRDDPEHELRIVRALAERRVDGVLLAPSGLSGVEFLAGQAPPVVLLDRFLDVPLDQVGAENEAPTAELVAHLAGLGHTRIGMVAGVAGLSTTVERVAGYRRGMADAGLAPLVVEGGSQRDLARAAAHELLALEDPPTALVSGNNFMTIGILRALAERSRRVPQDVALVGFDDFEWADLLSPRLTVIAQPVAEIGARAVELLLSRLEDPSLATRRVRLAASFRHRESCGCATEHSRQMQDHASA